MGKLNIWQWLGVVLLIVGVVMYINRNASDKEKANTPKPNTSTVQPTPATQPVPAVSTQPATPPG